MGIDPNNHRLNHTLPPRQRQHGSNSTSSSGSKSQVCEPCDQQMKSQGDNDQVSDAASCLNDESCSLPDLNLDLTKATSSPLTTAPEMKQHEPKATPTLLLFQWLDRRHFHATHLSMLKDDNLYFFWIEGPSIWEGLMWFMWIRHEYKVIRVRRYCHLQKDGSWLAQVIHGNAWRGWLVAWIWTNFGAKV